METLLVRVYEGRKLLYNKKGDVANESQVIKMALFHYMNKFLKYYNTLGPVMVTLERVYVMNKKGECVDVSEERFAELDGLLKDTQSKATPKAKVDPVQKENEELKARLDRLEKLISEQKSKPVDLVGSTDEKPEPKSEPLPKAKRKRAKK